MVFVGPYACSSTLCTRVLFERHKWCQGFWLSRIMKHDCSLVLLLTKNAQQNINIYIYVHTCTYMCTEMPPKQYERPSKTNCCNRPKLKPWNKASAGAPAQAEVFLRLAVSRGPHANVSLRCWVQSGVLTSPRKEARLPARGQRPERANSDY